MSSLVRTTLFLPLYLSVSPTLGDTQQTLLSYSFFAFNFRPIRRRRRSVPSLQQKIRFFLCSQRIVILLHPAIYGYDGWAPTTTSKLKWTAFMWERMSSFGMSCKVLRACQAVRRTRYATHSHQHTAHGTHYANHEERAHIKHKYIYLQ